MTMINIPMITLERSFAFALGLLVLSGAVICSPVNNQQQATASSQSGGSGNVASSTMKPVSIVAINTVKPTTPSAAISISSDSASTSSRSNGESATIRRSVESGADLEAFDGKNPFSDDSLWQIPVNLVRDLSASEGSSDNLAKSASEQSQASEGADLDEDFDDIGETLNGAKQVNLQQSSSSSPTVISASTDLKTAAGYHYPSHGGHHGHYSGHDSHGHAGHDGHYAGDHYGGKYFQYASVPYPYAWDFGYRRGNPYHTIERYEHGKGPHFQTKVKWSDKHGGYGVHVWDYNHDDHHSHHYDSHGPSSHYSGHHGAHYGHH